MERNKEQRMEGCQEVIKGEWKEKKGRRKEARKVGKKKVGKKRR